MAYYLGIDTSNYTTSVACYNADLQQQTNHGRLLPVADGKLGLRQSDAVFAHLKAIPDLCQRLSLDLHGEIAAVGVSARPRPCEGSYMPCFVAGVAIAQAMAAVLQVPCFETTHQEGHLAAVLSSEKRFDLFETEFLAWHLSGGTTELLLVRPKQCGFCIEKIGGTTDISAGQLIDRTGQKLSLSFPSGKALDQLAQAEDTTEFFRPKVNQCEFSLSGVENKVKTMVESNASSSGIARFVLLTISAAVREASTNARKKYGKLPLVFSGGVASNSVLRTEMQALDAIFAAPRFSTDNALGCAVLAARSHEGART